MQVTDATAARSMGLDALEAGAFVEQAMTFDTAAVDAFIALSGDRAAHHVDAAAGRAMGLPGRVVHGFFVAARFSRLLGMYLPGQGSVIQSVKLDYRAPVPIGATVVFRAAVSRVVPAVRTVILDLKAASADGSIVYVTGTSNCVVMSGA
jgi:3-hydroxybutyryl-CoA dehydratase